VKLNANKIRMVRNFNNLYQIGVGVDSGSFHAGFLKLLEIFVVKLKTMAMAFVDNLAKSQCAVGSRRLRVGL
jgi:hypothetical protein